MSMTRKDYELIAEVEKVFSADRPEFEWLNMVRDHGSMNMFQAGQSLQDAFGLNQREAKKVLLEWMQLVQKKAHTEQHS
jgi:hypothetical protein